MSVKAKITELMLPDLYIRRGGPDKEHISELRAILRESGKTWPFPPILVTPSPGEKPKKPLTVVDGVHRLVAADEEGWTEVPAILRKMTAVQFIAEQIKTNLHGGALRLDYESRDAGIRLLKSEGVDSKDIASMTGLSVVSVNRIVKGTQRTGETGKRKKAAKTRGKKGKKGKKGQRPGSGTVTQPNSLTVEEFFSGVETLVGEFRKNSAGILAGAGMVSPTTVRDFYLVARALSSPDQPIPDELRPVTERSAPELDATAAV